MIRAPYGKAAANWRPAPRALNGIADIWRTMKVVARIASCWR